MHTSSITNQTMQSAGDKTDKFQDVQYAFARHLRDPENSPPPANIEDRRLGIYRELVYNGIERFMASSFPVLRKITADDDWHVMMRDYVCNHQAHTPLFTRMPTEFLRYLENEHSQHPEYQDFILELATYEYAEVSMAIDIREIDMTGTDADGDLLAGIPVLNPIIMPQTYSYPVHRIGPDHLPDKPSEQPFYLLVYRCKDDTVKFLELNPVSARLIDCIQADDDATGLQLLQGIAKELEHPDPQVVIDGGHQIMCEMRDKDVLLGVKAIV